jgi:hypothetical protein
MNLLTKRLLWVIFVSLPLVSARAEDGNVQTGDALICGTAEQAKAFVASHPDNLEAAVAAANGKGVHGTCLSAQIAYVPGKAIGRIERPNVTYVVTEIMIVGVTTPYGIMAIKPDVAYTVLKVKEEAA